DTSYISQTVIDANWNGSVVRFTNQEDSTAELCGFTLTHGTGAPVMRGSGGLGFCGGGIFIAGSGPYLHHLRIINNEASYRGGGIFIKTLKPLQLHDVQIVNNRAENIGGGICMEIGRHPPYPVFRNVVIIGCEAYSGGGLSLNSSTLFVDRMEIIGNTANIGGGIDINYSHLVSAQLVIAQNTGRWSGGGTHIYGGTLEMTNGAIVGNSTGGNGGGCAVEINGRVSLTSSNISQNQANSNGGGLSHTTLNYPNTGTIWLTTDNTTFYDNHALGGSGGGIYSETNDVLLSRTSLANNAASDDGGGIFCRGTLTVTNTLIVENAAGLSGGGFLSKHNITLTNVTIAFNLAGVGGGGVIQAYESYLSTQAKFTNIISWNNDPLQFVLDPIKPFAAVSAMVNYCTMENGQLSFDTSGSSQVEWGDGNLDQDPLFTNPTDSNFHLSASSPCIDTGDPAPEFNDADGSRNDMGAYGGPGFLE
ncbi:hypothetical protein ACFL6Q_06990, partial [Candidatus Neomarinimicrobiota bacterium]